MRLLEALDARFGQRPVETVDRARLISEPTKAALELTHRLGAASDSIARAAGQQTGGG
jgi:hypothetical protein